MLGRDTKQQYKELRIGVRLRSLGGGGSSGDAREGYKATIQGTKYRGQVEEFRWRR
jgi:hypothetical protein